MGLEPVSAADAIDAPVQWVVSPGGSLSVSATTRSAARLRTQRLDAAWSRSGPSKPSSMKRSRHRQTQVLDLAVRRMISFVPTPSAVRGAISADLLLRRVAVLYEAFEPANILGRNGERFSCAHSADSHAEFA
jgi:hypothetical protein